MKLLPVVSASLLSLLLSASPLQAQGLWTFDVRAGASVATEQFADTDLDTGIGLEGTLSYRILPALSVYGGWDWQHRRAATTLFGAPAEVEDTGYVFGVRYIAPRRSPATPWVRAGALYNHIEVESTDGAILVDSAHTWGWEFGGGLDLVVGEAWSLTPGVRYRRFEPTARFGGVESPVTLSYLVFDVGVGFSWGGR
jgi:outer membrane protein W